MNTGPTHSEHRLPALSFKGCCKQVLGVYTGPSSCRMYGRTVFAVQRKPQTRSASPSVATHWDKSCGWGLKAKTHKKMATKKSDSVKLRNATKEWDSVNPFTVPACKIFGGQRYTDAPENSIISGPITHLFSVLCVLMKSLSHASAEKEDKKA